MIQLSPPIMAIAWEIWARNKWKYLAALFCLMVCRWMCERNSEVGITLGFGTTAMALFLVMGALHFTEGDRKGGFGSFPKRLFTLPITTLQLVWTPMLLGTLSVTACYLVSVWMLLRPLGSDPTILWPCLYLSCGMASFQAILWAFPERRYLKLFLLSIFATVLALGWMFFLPHMLEGTLQQFGIRSSPRRFQLGLTVMIILWTCAAYGLAWLAVARRRQGREGWCQDWGLVGFYQNVSKFRRSRTFADASSAMFWMEWNQSGKTLPMAILIIMLVTFIPTSLTAPHNESETIAALVWMLLTPLLMALVIGLGASKPDFWKPGLELPLFQSIKPIRTGDWVWTKVKVGALSVLACWFIIFCCIFLWVAYLGDLSAFEPFWHYFKGYQRDTMSRLLFVGMGIGVLILMTWRFYLLSLPCGLSGSKVVYFSFNTVVVAFLFVLVAMVIRQTGDTSSMKLHETWPLIARLPWVLTGLVCAKFVGVAFVWSFIQKNSIASQNIVRVMMISWVVVTVWLLTFVHMAVAPGMDWILYLLTVLSLLACPLLSPGLAMIGYSRNRSR